MIAFMPWATVQEPTRFGEFEIMPFESAATAGAVPDELIEAIGAIFRAHGYEQQVDWERRPIVRALTSGFVDDLDADTRREYFAFRTRLAFAGLAKRQFFGHRYCNGDNLQLVIQAFTPDHAGGAAIRRRRRDGYGVNIVAAGKLHIPRPAHVSIGCELGQDLDASLLTALEALSTDAGPIWPRVADAIELCVRGNTDSPDVSPHNELTDLVGAFGRLADAWEPEKIVKAFVGLLPQPPVATGPFAPPPLSPGPKWQDARIQELVQKHGSLRGAWLTDAYILRSQYSHGRLQSPYASGWSTDEHLLLGAFIFPLVVKALLVREHQYVWAPEDRLRDRAVDTLLTQNLFDIPASTPADPADPRSPWGQVMYELRMRAAAEEICRQLQDEQ
jgi:hypothetical protein